MIVKQILFESVIFKTKQEIPYLLGYKHKSSVDFIRIYGAFMFTGSGIAYRYFNLISVSLYSDPYFYKI